MRILSLSTLSHCGVASYNQKLQAAFHSLGLRYDVEPITDAMRAGRTDAFDNFLKRIDSYDALVLQHEFTLFGGRSRAGYDCFGHLMQQLNHHKKPTVVFVHSANFQKPERGRLFSIQGTTAKTRRAYNYFIRSINRSSATIFVHGSHAVPLLLRHKINLGRIKPTPFPNERTENCFIRRDNGTVTIGIHGFVAEYKGYECLLQAMAVLPDNFRLLIAGGRHPVIPNDLTLNNIYGFLHTGKWIDASLPALDVPPDRLASLRERVTITGYIDEERINDVFKQMDIVVAPYIYFESEGSGALGTALARGMPIIASATKAFTSIYRESHCIQLVAIRAPFELANAVKNLAADAAERERLSQAALGFAASHSYEALARECLKVFNEGSDNTHRFRIFSARSRLGVIANAR